MENFSEDILNKIYIINIRPSLEAYFDGTECVSIYMCVFACACAFLCMCEC